MTEGTPTVAAKKVLAVLSGVLKDPPDGDGKAPDADSKGDARPIESISAQAQDMAQRARKAYDTALKWIVSVFAAVGTLVFASVPFAELTGVSPLWVFGGLGATALGLSLVVIGYAKGVELQDASLGELASTFEGLRPPRRGTRWLRPLRTANSRLQQILTSDEKQAHLGPGVDSVDDLIKLLGDLEAKSLECRFGAACDGSGVADISAFRGTLAFTRAKRALRQTELEQVAKDLETLRAQVPDSSNPVPGAARQIRVLVERHTVLSRQLAADTQDDRATMEALDILRDEYRGYRTWVLSESAVAQMRGTFRIARNWVVTGSLLVGAGGVAYAYALANPVSLGETRNPVTVTLSEDAPGATAIEECDVGNGSAPFEGLLISSSDADGRQDGPFTVVPLDGGCAGIEPIEVAEGEGTYAARPPGTETDPVP